MVHNTIIVQFKTPSRYVCPGEGCACFDLESETCQLYGYAQTPWVNPDREDFGTVQEIYPELSNEDIVRELQDVFALFKCKECFENTQMGE